MKLYWALLLSFLLLILFAGLTTNTNSSQLLGFLAFVLIFAGIPYTIYKTFPASYLALIVAAASPIILGFS